MEMNLNTKISKLWRKKRSVTITEYDPTYKVVYLGNVLTAWAKGEGCADKPLTTLWKNYCHNVRPDVHMKITICNSGLKAVTKEHGLTEYWSHRITYWVAHPHYPKVFAWVYRHEGKKLRQELRCHAVLCSKDEVARRMTNQLQDKLALALQEFKREKMSRQNARLSLANSVYANPSLPRRKILLCTGSANYRPPTQRSKSAPKLMAIEEAEDDDVFQTYNLAEEEEEEERGIEVEEENANNERTIENEYMLIQERYKYDSARQQHRLRLLNETRLQLDRTVTDKNGTVEEEEEEEEDEIEDEDLQPQSDDILENCEMNLKRFESILGTALLHMRGADVDDNDENFNRNPRVHDDDDDISSGTPCSTSSTSSPPSLRCANANAEDNLSDESGYSEENCLAQRSTSPSTETAHC